MNALALFKARQRLEKARDSLTRVQTAWDHKTFRFAWTDFLHAANSVFTILEQGARANPQSRQWFGGKKNFRRKDPLLSYMHQARNSDEHGIEDITRQTQASYEVPSDSDRLVRPTEIKDGQIVWAEVPGDTGIVWITVGFAVELIAVTDIRFNTSVQPPKEHLGVTLVDESPQNVARLLLTYLECLIAEASALPPTS